MRTEDVMLEEVKPEKVVKEVWHKREVEVAKGKGNWWLVMAGGRRFIMKEVEKFYYE